MVLDTLWFLRSGSPRKLAFKHQRFPRNIILCAGIFAFRFSTKMSWISSPCVGSPSTDRQSSAVCLSSPPNGQSAEGHLRRASQDWHVDETYLRLTTGRDVKAARTGTLKIFISTASGISTDRSLRQSSIDWSRKYTSFAVSDPMQ